MTSHANGLGILQQVSSTRLVFAWVGVEDEAVHVEVSLDVLVLVIAPSSGHGSYRDPAAAVILGEVEGGKMLLPGSGLGPVDGHHVAKVPRDGPPHLALVHDLLLRANLEKQSRGEIAFSVSPNPPTRRTPRIDRARGTPLLHIS